MADDSWGKKKQIKVPKIDKLDALGDAITTILKTILTTNRDNK